MARVGPRGQYDIILESSDDASPTTTVGLMLARDEVGKPLWEEERTPPIPPQRLSGPIQYASKDPRSDLVWSQVTWKDGALEAINNDLTSTKYAKSDGLDMRGDGVVTLGMLRSTRMGFLIENPDAEDNAVDMLTIGVGGTVTNVTTDPHGGSRHFRFDSNATADTVYWTANNPTVYQSREVTFYCYAKVNGDSTYRLQIVDSGGTTQTAVQSNTTYSLVSVTRTIDAAATYVRFVVQENTTNPTGSIDFDDAFIVPTGGIVCNGLAEIGDALYGIFGRCICLWDETNDIWNAVRIDSANACNDIVEYNGNIYVSFSGDNAYVYGSSTTWTASTIAADAKYAYFWAVSQGTLWKTRKDGGGAHNFVNSSTNPVNGGSWGTEATIGSSDREITRLYAFNDTVIAGKEDGLHVYNRVVNDFSAADTWQNVTQEWEVFVDPDNFSRGQDWHGNLYMIASQQSLFYLAPNRTLVDISSLFTAPRLTDFGGRVRAMTSDPMQLWLLVDTPTADTTVTKTTWLMSLRIVRGQFVLHTMEQVAVGDINELSANRGYLWALGRVYNSDASDYEAAIYRWTLPTKTVHPAYDPTPAINTQGSFDTPVIDFGLPDEDKALIGVTIVTEPNVLDQTGRSVVVDFGVDQASSTGTNLTTFTGAGAIQTAYFDSITTPESNAICKSVQLNVELNTNATSDTTNPKVYGLILHALLRPKVLRLWRFWVAVNAFTNTGARSETLKSTVLTNLSTLESAVYPIELTEDLDADGTETTHRGIIVPGSLRRRPEEERDQGVEIYSFDFQKVVVA